MMTDLETLWREKSDEEVMEAGAVLSEYTLEGQGVIRAELLRRGLRPAQPQPSFLEGSGSGVPDIPEGMLLVMTPSLESHTISRYLGVVFGEAILGADIFSDLFASVTGIVGGRSSAYESALADARRIALSDMAKHASEAGANAVVSIDVKYETIRGTMLMVTCCGTAVEVS